MSHSSIRNSFVFLTLAVGACSAPQPRHVITLPVPGDPQASKEPTQQTLTPAAADNSPGKQDSSRAAPGTTPAAASSNNTQSHETPSTTQPDDSPASATQGTCVMPHYGLATTPIAQVTTQYAVAGDLQNLPTLSLHASTPELKRFVAATYDLFPVFKQIFEGNLGLTRMQVLAFLYADMSRESATNLPDTGKVGWNIALETAFEKPGDSAHAWGPFQAAVTNFHGGGYDDQIESATGLPIPEIAQFKDPAISTFAGMKRLAEGILRSMKTFGAGEPASLYLLGSLADHNTGWPSAAKEASWLSSYGNEVLRLMQGYLHADNLTNDRVFWTGEPEQDICR